MYVCTLDFKTKSTVVEDDDESKNTLTSIEGLALLKDKEERNKRRPKVYSSTSMREKTRRKTKRQKQGRKLMKR